jgi:hypothetical protein
MKKITCSALLLMTMCGLSTRADEAATLTKSTPPADTSGGYSGKLGAGLIVGEPTGGSVKFWLNDRMALDGAVGWSFEDHTDLYMHSDVLWHNFDLISVSHGQLPVYLGAGGLVRFRDDNRDNQVGIRVPVGLSYMPDGAPVDIFAEIGPAVDVAPKVRGEITGGVGIRYWF